MSHLLQKPPFESRDEGVFLEEMNSLTRWHLAGCPKYRRIWPDWRGAESLEDLPMLHVGLFKHLYLKTQNPHIEHQRDLISSATTGVLPSKIALDSRSSQLQAESSLAILQNMVGPARRPLLVLDSAKSLRRRGEIAARIAAAMSLKPLASEIHFLLDQADDDPKINWHKLPEVLQRHDDLLVYGFTWILWLAWADGRMPEDVRALLTGKRIHFVHSGGWKKLQRRQIDRKALDARLLEGLSPLSRVVDYYGLVEQVGIVYPLCEEGFRHVPRWAAVLVRDAWTLEPLLEKPGLLQLMNTIALGAPYHNVLTEDLGRLVSGECPCGRSGQRFELLGRAEKAETRGCANV